MNVLRSTRFAAAVALAAMTLASYAASPPAYAQAQTTGIVAGTVVTQDAGLPVSGATVQLLRSGTVAASATTDAGGAFSFNAVAEGIYSLDIRFQVFQETRLDDLAVTGGTTRTERIAILRARTVDSGQLREIGRTSTSANGNAALISSSTIQYDLNPSQLSLLGQLKSADQLQLVPGVNLSGTPHTVGDDTSIDIRGMGPGEVRPLLDGHPIGPIGVMSPDYFDYANSSFLLLSNIQVTEGSGATGLYGTDVIGGTIDMQTLVPTRTPQANVSQTVGNEGIGQTLFTTTGSFGRVGYVLGHVVTGTYGDFQPGQRFQSARPDNDLNLPNGGACTASNDLTSCNAALNTYSVSGNYRVQADLAKLQYTFVPGTTLSLTAYASNQLSDSTGNGDNDDIPYDTRLAEIQAQPQTCPGGYLVITDTNPNACYTAQQYANASYGPYGGGEDRNRGTSLQDFHARFQLQLPLDNQFTVDVFAISTIIGRTRTKRRASTNRERSSSAAAPTKTST